MGEIEDKERRKKVIKTVKTERKRTVRKNKKRQSTYVQT